MRGVTEIVGPKSIVGTAVYALTDTGPLPDGVHVGVPWYVDAPESINEAFVVDYDEAYGEKPTIDAAYGYTSVLLIARAVEAECSNERADVITGLEKTKDASSVFGRFSFTKKGEPIHPMYLLKVKDGTPTPP
jgi:branched-chain amino acid transport system substrate-binding protein